MVTTSAWGNEGEFKLALAVLEARLIVTCGKPRFP
jgi:hypothetical protein